MSKGKLTPKQAMFCKEYLVDLNITQAAIRAGYSKKTACVIGVENLKKPNIAAEIQRLMDKRAERVEINADNVLRELSLLGFSNILNFVTIQPDGTAVIDLTNVTRDQAAAITEITVDEYMDKASVDEEGNPRPVKRVKLKTTAKEKSLELIGKHLKLFTDKTQISVDDPLAQLMREIYERGKPLVQDPNGD